MLDRLKEKNLHTWLRGYAQHLRQSAWKPSVSGPRHLLFAFCDHYEPLWGKATQPVGEARVRAWVEQYPHMTEPFRDTFGRRPQHTFFFPGEEYRPEFFDGLDNLVRQGCGEVELHLHHHNATEDSLRADIRSYLATYAERGHFSRDETGRFRFAFIHGDWALANARPDGRSCGVDAELQVLFDEGCYADFTFPAAPDIAQPKIVNQIYWPMGELRRRRAYECGVQAKVGETFSDRLLMIEGPLAITRRPRSLTVRIENSAVTANDPATPSRIDNWVSQNIHVTGRPEWVFVKVHTHGAPEKQAASLLTDKGRQMHAELCGRYNDGRSWVLHYVTAREMFNIALAAMAGRTGNPDFYRDFVLTPPPIVAAARA